MLYFTKVLTAFLLGQRARRSQQARRSHHHASGVHPAPLFCALARIFNLDPLQKFVRQFEGKPGNDMLAEIYSMLAQLMFNTHRLEQVRAACTLHV